MAKSMRKTLVLAKIQASAGTDPIPDGSANAILCRAATPTPVVTETADRNLIRPYFGNGGQIVTSYNAEVEIEVELAGSGEVGTAPAYSPLLRACGFAEDITADTSVEYTPVSDNLEFVTIYTYLDGLLHKMVDARGTVSIDVTSKAIPFLRFRFIGTYNPVADASNPAGVDYSAFIKPLGVNRANTPAWEFHGYTGCLQAMTMDLANNLVYRNLIGCSGAEITDRAPTGNAILEAPSIANFNFADKVVKAELGLFSVTHGTAAGNIVKIDMPKVQLVNPTYSDQDGIAMLNVGLSIQPDEGNDEISITYT